MPKETFRTLDLTLTRGLLCQLSYMGLNWCRGRVLKSRPRAYRARALPLSYLDETYVGWPVGIEPTSTAITARGLDHLATATMNLVEKVGIEPTACCLQSSRSPN